MAALAVAPVATALKSAGSLAGAAKALVTEAVVNPMLAQSTLLTGASEAISLYSANMALENEDYSNAIMHIAFSGAYMELFTGCASHVEQNLSNAIAAKNAPANSHLPYATSRPGYRQGVVEKVWENA